MAAVNNDRPRQNQRKDNAESSKPKGQKRKGDDLVAAAERSRPSRPPRTNDFAKVMESTCPFHPKGNTRKRIAIKTGLTGTPTPKQAAQCSQTQNISST